MNKFLKLLTVLLALSVVLAACSGGGGGGGGGAQDLKVFVTSTTYNGNLGGLAGADAICQARANAGGLSGTYKAWLSTSTTDAYCHIQGYDNAQLPNCGLASPPTAAGPWVRTHDGYAFADTIDKLVNNGQVYAAIKYDQTGTLQAGEYYFTGTAVNGRATTDNCSNWTSASGSLGGTFGNTDGTTNDWTSFGTPLCNDTHHLLCMQTGSGVALPARTIPAGAKRVFITSTAGTGNISTWAGSGAVGGLTGADNVCKARATAALLANASSYKAWLSDGSTNAINHVTVTATGPWYRLDGVKIADNVAALTTSPLFSTITYTETGTYVGDNWVWTGTGTNGVATGNNCSNWGSTSGTGRIGWSSQNSSEWTNLSDQNCTGSAALYCFEDD
jgi:hypothetical protein